MCILSFCWPEFSLLLERQLREYCALFVDGDLLTKASFSATMVTAILPSLTNDDSDGETNGLASPNANRNPRLSAAFSIASEVTITPERYTRNLSQERSNTAVQEVSDTTGKPSALAGYVGMFTGCGALVALVLFLPLPTNFGEIDGVTQAQAVKYSFYVVAAVALFVAAFVFVGLKNLKGEEGKGWRLLFGRRSWYDESVEELEDADALRRRVSNTNIAGDQDTANLPTETDSISAFDARLCASCIHRLEDWLGVSRWFRCASFHCRHFSVHSVVYQHLFY